MGSSSVNYGARQVLTVALARANGASWNLAKFGTRTLPKVLPFELRPLVLALSESVLWNPIDFLWAGLAEIVKHWIEGLE